MFPLPKLPTLALDEVRKSMSLPERLKLSLASKRMERTLGRLARKQSLSFLLIVNSGVIRLSVMKTETYIDENENDILLMIKDKTTENQLSDVELKSSEMVSWSNPNKSYIQNKMHISKKVMDIIPCNSLELVVYTDRLSSQFIRDLLADPDSKNFDTIRFFGKRIDGNTLKMFMDWCNPSNTFHIFETKIPRNYRHDKAFKFPNVSYGDAKWVKIGNLLSMENCQDVILGKNKFSSADFNRFLKYRINCEHEMFQALNCEMNDIQMDVVFEDIVHVVITFLGQTYFIIASSAQRHPRILAVHKVGTILAFFTWSPEEEMMFGNGAVKSFAKEYEVLNILGRMKSLKQLLEEGTPAEIEEIVANETEVLAEIRKLKDGLTANNAVLQNGKIRVL